MLQWFKYFKVWLIVCGLVIVVGAACMISKNANKGNAVRVNEVCTETERVFDAADVLTDEQEQSLRELIAESEQEAQCDIVLVTWNSSLESYAKEYDSTASGFDYAMIFADNFYDEAGFGWNKYVEADDGDGVLLLDNWFREADGKVYTWLSTSGIVEDTYSSEMIDSLLDEVYEYIDTNPYEAYASYVRSIARTMGRKNGNVSAIPGYVIFIVPIIVAVIFICVNLSGKEGRKTTVSDTYLEKPAEFRRKEDTFLRKTTTSRKIETSSGSGGGGGGHHTSSGGHSHGGGGHSR